MSDSSPSAIALIDLQSHEINNAPKTPKTHLEGDQQVPRRCRLRNNNSIVKEEFLIIEETSPHEVTKQISSSLLSIFYVMRFAILLVNRVKLRDLGLMKAIFLHWQMKHDKKKKLILRSFHEISYTYEYAHFFHRNLFQF